jgi:hypothetical protein
MTLCVAWWFGSWISSFGIRLSYLSCTSSATSRMIGTVEDCIIWLFIFYKVTLCYFRWWPETATQKHDGRSSNGQRFASVYWQTICKYFTGQLKSLANNKCKLQKYIPTFYGRSFNVIRVGKNYLLIFKNKFPIV